MGFSFSKDRRELRTEQIDQINVTLYPNLDLSHKHNERWQCQVRLNDIEAINEQFDKDNQEEKKEQNELEKKLNAEFQKLTILKEEKQKEIDQLEIQQTDVEKLMIQYEIQQRCFQNLVDAQKEEIQKMKKQKFKNLDQEFDDQLKLRKEKQ